MLSDALISVAVVIAGIFIYFFKIYYIDSILTVLFSVYILYHSYPLLKKSFLSLMDINITTVDEIELKNILLEDDNILEYNDLHIHKPSSKHTFISLNLVLKSDDINILNIEEITSKIKVKLKENGFNHIVIQVTTKTNIKNHSNCIL
jgi:cobalt-zinc-cadmium efflux system protein